jgi:hypothetical protein
MKRQPHSGAPDSLGGRENRRGFRHEVHATEDDHIRVCLCGLLGQPERIAYEVRDVLNFRDLIVVREDHRVAVLAHPIDLGNQCGCVRRAIYCGYDIQHCLA